MVKKIDAKYGFNIQEINDGLKIDYDKAKYGLSLLFFLIIGWAIIYFMVVPSLLSEVNDKFILKFFFWSMPITPILFWIYLNLKRSKGGSFLITSEAIEVNGSAYILKDIPEIYISNIKGGIILRANNNDGTFFVSEGAIASSLAATAKMGHALGLLLSNSIKKPGYRISFPYGKIEIHFATQLDEVGVKMLFQKTLELLSNGKVSKT